VLLLPMAWSTAFLLPGVAIVVWMHGGIRRAGALVLVYSGLLAILYVVFIRPNMSPELRASYFLAGAQNQSPGLLAAFVFCVAAALRAMYLFHKRPDSRACIQIPATPRTRLFVLPCFLLVAAMNAEDLAGQAFSLSTRLPQAMVWLITIAVGTQAAWKQVREHKNLPEEDYAGAIQLLRQRVAAADLLLVHPSVLEGFKLYTAIEGWHDHPPIYGDTGWPCCRRDMVATHFSSTERALSEDLDRKVPRGFTGRVWLFYSARHTHWMYVGLDEGELWREHLWSRGCPPTGPYLKLQNLAISAMDCPVGRGFGPAAELPPGATTR
jgi:hypothetical protein